MKLKVVGAGADVVKSFHCGGTPAMSGVPAGDERAPEQRLKDLTRSGRTEVRNNRVQFVHRVAARDVHVQSSVERTDLLQRRP